MSPARATSPVAFFRGARGSSSCSLFRWTSLFQAFTLCILSFYAGSLYSSGDIRMGPRSEEPSSTYRSRGGVSVNGNDGGDVRATIGAGSLPRVSRFLPVPDRVLPSRRMCDPAGRRGGPSCVFEHLLLREGRLYFVIDGARESIDEVGLVPPGLRLSHDMNVPDTLGAVLPSVVTLETVAGWTGGATPPAITTLPVQLFARLNPGNIYHHLWDDMGFAHSLGCKLVASVFARGDGPGGGASDGGCVPGVTPPFAVWLVDSFAERNIEQWQELVAIEARAWPPTVPNDAPGGVAVIPLIAMGSRGACTHRRHCTDIISPAPVKLWQQHLRAHHGVVTMLPPPGARQKAVIVKRTGSRQLTNIDEIVELMPLMGFDPVVIGPFKGMSYKEQFDAFANASLAIFVFGAELGPAWVGMPDGSCTAVLHPAGTVESLSYWIADKVGLKVTTMIEVFKRHDDPRLAPERKAGKLYSDIWIDLFAQDFRIDPKDLWRQTWCTDAPWPPD